jgi:hypothetical protein
VTEIEKLRIEVDRLRDDLKEAEDALRAAIIAATGYEEGDVVEAIKKWGRAQEWRPAIIRRIYPGYVSDNCRFAVSFAKKDGEWSKVVADWCEVRKPE